MAGDELHADVVVAGAGAAGTAAALAAAERGARVLLLDAREDFRTRCNTSMTSAMIPAAGSRWQREAGSDDEPQRFYDDIMRKTGGQADAEVARALTDVAPELLAWLADAHGVPLQLVTDFSYPGHSRDRCHTVPDRSGTTLHGHLLAAVDALDAVTLAIPQRLVGVARDADGAVVGARTTAGDGGERTVACGAVVLATNGFAANPDLVRTHIPEIAGGTYHGGPASVGDALAVAEQVGADTAFLDAYQGHGSLTTPQHILLTWAAVMHGGVLVNRLGRRFGDETVGYSEYAARVLDQPDGVAHVVYDARIHDTLQPFAHYQECLRAGVVSWADDVSGLATAVGTDAAALAETLDAARAAASGAAPDVFGRSGWESPLEPPYAAARVTGALFHTQGGLRVDRHARVLRQQRPIAGLFAAGGAAAGISGHGADGYLAGNGLLSALGLGYLAGRAVELDA